MLTSILWNHNSVAITLFWLIASPQIAKNIKWFLFLWNKLCICVTKIHLKHIFFPWKYLYFQRLAQWHFSIQFILHVFILFFIFYLFKYIFMLLAPQIGPKGNENTRDSRLLHSSIVDFMIFNYLWRPACMLQFVASVLGLVYCIVTASLHNLI